MSARASTLSKLTPQASRVAPVPGRASAPQEAKIIAPGGGGNPLMGGMGIPGVPAVVRPADDEQKIGAGRKNFTGSSATRDFLRVNTVRNADLKLVDITGATLFKREVGVHVIPLQAFTDSIANAPSRDGAFVIGQGQALIVTHFQPYAAVPNVGLPGAMTEIDPVALLGQVSFSLAAQGGGQPLNMQMITSGSGSANGTSILSPHTGENHPPMTATIKTGSVQAIYQVSSPPFPGFPRVVGVRVKGYLIDALLLNAIMDTVIRGDINKLDKDTE